MCPFLPSTSIWKSVISFLNYKIQMIMKVMQINSSLNSKKLAKYRIQFIENLDTFDCRICNQNFQLQIFSS